MSRYIHPCLYLYWNTQLYSLIVYHEHSYQITPDHVTRTHLRIASLRAHLP
jgi:hypothetical protein